MADAQASFYCLECEMLVGSLDKCPVCDLQTLNLSTLPAKASMPADESILGQEFGGCQVSAVIARDARSITCRAKQISLNRPATLKLYPLGKLLLSSIRQTVHAARRVASLTHPSIAPIYKVGVREQILYVAMHESDRTLRDHLASRPINPAGALAIFKQLVEGVRFAQNEGLVHGDLKPESVLLDERGQCRIANFGTPTAAPEETPECQFYWPPERWLAKNIDGRADLYSLGVIFYQMLTGSRPFEVEEPQKLMFAHVNLPPAPPYQVKPGIPRELSAIAMKLLEKDPENRYPTAKELTDDLKRYDGNESVQAHEERRKTVVCKLCETENACDQVYCTFCKEPLSGKRPEVHMAVRADEFQCNVCKRLVERGSVACGNCMNAVCHQCKTAVSTGSSGLCPKCEAAKPPDPGLLKKMTDFFRKKK